MLKSIKRLKIIQTNKAKLETCRIQAKSSVKTEPHQSRKEEIQTQRTVTATTKRPSTSARTEVKCMRFCLYVCYYSS